MKKTGSVEEYISSQHGNEAALECLRGILLQCGLEETIKWGMPTYTWEGTNIVGIGAFKNWVCLWFHQGALLGDKGGYLINAQEGKTKALRQWRFKEMESIPREEVSRYVYEAISNANKGLKVKPKTAPDKKKKELIIPDLLHNEIIHDENLSSSFKKFSPAQKRDFIQYITEPKREETKKSRLKKILPLIREGKKLASLWTGTS